MNPGTRHAKSLLTVLIETLGELLAQRSANETTLGAMDHLEARVRDRGVLQAISSLRADLGEEISMVKVAQRAGLSVRSLNRKMLSETGLTPRQVLIRLRVERAQALLLGNRRTVTEVALEVGYNSLSQFIAAFRSVTGQLPSEFARLGQSPK